MKNNRIAFGPAVTFLIIIAANTFFSQAGFADPLPLSLKDAYEKHFAIGAAIGSSNLADAERKVLFQHFSTITPENCMKPGSVQPVEGEFHFSPGDALVQMAKDHGMTVNGHTLVWHSKCPEWYFSDGGQPASRDLLLKRLREHISRTAGHFKGQLASWDVVNEALDDGQDYLRNSKWLQILGEDYIGEAFLEAHKADPEAALYYNDYSIEYPTKRAKALKLIKGLKERNIPIHGIGIQGHWILDKIPFKDLEETILSFHAEGLKVAITELDLDVVHRKMNGADINAIEDSSADPYPRDLPIEIQKKQAEQYAQLFALLSKHSNKISRVTFWGLHDGKSWLNSWPRKRTNHALFWDRALKPKLALPAVLRVPVENASKICN